MTRQKFAKKRVRLKKCNFHTYARHERDFFQIYVFRQVLDITADCWILKFSQNRSSSFWGSRQKPLKKFFFPICDFPKIFQKSGSLSFVPWWWKTNWRSLRYSKQTNGQTDHGRTDMGDYIEPVRINQGPKLLYIAQLELNPLINS